MKTDRKIKAEKSPPKGRAVKGNSRAVPKSNGKHLLAIYEHIPVGIAEASLDGRYMDVNEEFCRILGYSRRELLRRGIKDCTHEDDYGIDVRLYEQLIDGKIPFYRIEKRYVRKDGEIIWVEITRSLVCDEQGKPIYTVGVVLDISDRKDVERVLRESVERLRLATGAAQMFMWEWDFQTDSYIIADSFEQVLGFSAGLLPINKFETLWALSPKEDIELISKAFERAVEQQSDLYAMPIRVINPENGQIVWLEISAKIVYDRAGKPERMFGVAQNITESKKARDEIAIISRMPEENPHPVMRLTPEGTVLYANPAARPLVDYWTRRAGQPIPEEIQRAITEAFTSGVKPEFELEYREKFFSCTLAPVPTAGYVNLYASDITERRRAEERLRDSEERFRALVSQATAGISETDLEGRLIFVNAAFCEMLGYSEMELLGKTIWELTFTEDLEENKRLFKRMVDQDKPYQFEKRFIRKDGSLLWTSVSVTVIHDSADEPKGGVGVVLNIEKRKQAEAALAEYARQQESLYRLSDELHHTESLTAVFDASLDAILSALQCDRASILLYDDANVMRFVAWRGLSEGYRKATDGHSPWKPEERDPQPVVMDDVRTPELSESLRAVIQVEGIASLAFIPLVSNGRLIGKFMVYFDAPHAFEEGELDFGLTIARLLASAIGRKRADVQLRESEERFRTLANAMPSIVWTAAPDGKITYANDQWFQYAGITPEENARGWPELVLHPDDYQRCVREWNHALETVPDEYLIEVRNRRYDGQYRWFQTRAVPVRDASGRALAWYGVTTDIHERIEAENRLALLAEISELLRNFDAPNDLMYKITEAVGAHLHVKRALFNEIDLEQDRELVIHDYHDGIESVAGIHKVSDYSNLTSAEMAVGKTVVNTDSETDPRTAQDYQRTYAVSGERAYVAVPLMRDNRWVASFWVSDDGPRQWTSEEVSLLETVAERTWTIIEKLRINTALRESEQRYRAVVESQAEMLCRFLPDGTILFVNSAYARARGTMPEDLASRNFWDFVAEEDRPSVQAMLDSLTPEAPQVQIENRFYTTDGERWTLWTNRALSFDANGRWLEVQSSGIDITERKQVEEALRASEERMRLATDAAGMFAWEFDIQNKQFTLSENFAEVMGFPAEVSSTDNMDALLYLSPAEDAQTVQEMMSRAFESQEDLRDLQYRILNPVNGQVIWVEMNARTIYDREGKPERMYGVSQNITERKRIEEALAHERELLSRIFESIPVMLTIYDPSSKLMRLNRQFEQLTGWSSEDAIGVSLMETIYPDSEYREKVGQFMDLCQENEWMDIQMRTRDGRTLETSWSNIRLSNDMRVGIGIDITERKRAEEQLRESEQRYRFIVENTSDGIWWIELTEPMPTTLPEDEQIDWYYKYAVIRQCNLGMARMYGYDSIEEVIGLPLHLVMPREDPVNLELSRQFVRSGYRLVDAESREQDREGRQLVFLNNMVGIIEDGKLKGEWGTNRDITERKRAEEALRESEERYRGIVNQTIGGIAETDLTGKFIMVNDRYCEMTGYSREQLLNEMRMQDVTHPDDLPKNLELFGRLMAERTSFEIEKRYIRSNGSVIWVHNSVSAITDAHGKPKSAVAAVIDVTERKRVEEALRASESLYRTIARSIPGGGVYVVDKDFRYIVAEGPVTEAFGLSREKLEGRTVIESFPDERGARMENRLRRTFAGETVSFETEHAGRFYWTQQAPLLDSIGHAIIVTLDITERKRAEEALRQSEERFAHFMQHLPGLAWIKDIHGRYVYANAAAEKAFNMPSEMLYGLRDEDIFPAEVAGQFRRNDELALQDEKGVQVIETLVHADGVLHFSLVSKFPIPGPDGSTSLIGGTAFDVTERLRAEEALRESEERFRAILRQATAGIVRKDAEGRLIFVNEAFCNMLGYTEADLLGKTMWDFMHEGDIAESKRSYERLMLEGIPFKLERRLLRKDGTVIWVDASVSPIVDSTGKSRSAVTVEVDITGHKQAVESLRASEERYRNLFELVPVAVYSCDANGLIQEYNHRAVGLWGREPRKNDPSEKYCGSYRIFYPDGRFMPPEQSPMARALKGETIQPHEFEILVEREDGQRRNVVSHPLILRNEYSDLTGAINCLYDITERKQAEEALQQLNLQLEERVLSRTAKLRAVNQALRDEIAERQRIEDALRKSEAAARENEEKLSTLFELLPVGISFLDLQGQIIQMNTALAHILKMPKARGSTEAELSRKYIRANGTIMPPGEFASRRALTEGKTVYNVETGVILEDNEVVWTSVSAAPVNVVDVGAVVVTVDITESKRAERALQESRERLQVLSQRLVEVQEDERRAIARELHDRVGQTLAALNINLIIISGQLGGKVDEQVSTRLNDSMKLVAETIALVRDVMSNLRPSVLDDYGLEAAVESHLTQFTSRYEIQTRFEKPEQPIPRLGPSIEMTFLRIAQEALMNTVKHAQASQVRLTLRREENTICMTVQDNGLGITSWQNANRPGSHGLTIMRERAEAFGGSLKLNSVPGKGTTVEVKIPIDTSDLSQSEKEKSQ